MYLTSYTFTGDTADLAARYDRLLAQFRDELVLHIAVATDTGLVVLDSCPDRATAEEFQGSTQWREGLASVGLFLIYVGWLVGSHWTWILGLVVLLAGAAGLAGCAAVGADGAAVGAQLASVTARISNESDLSKQLTSFLLRARVLRP